MSEALRLELAPDLAVEWRLGGLMRAADAADGSAPPAWTAAVDWERTQALRLISCAAGDEALAIVAARPAGASHHDEDLVAGVHVAPDGLDAAEETLLSTEYDADGRVRRLGLELWLAGGAGMRVAADRSGADFASEPDGVAREVTPMTFQLGSAAGAGLHELVRARP